MIQRVAEFMKDIEFYGELVPTVTTAGSPHIRAYRIDLSMELMMVVNLSAIYPETHL